MTDLPAWMFQHVQDARQLFGAGGAEWHVNATMSDKPGGGRDNAGCAYTDPMYLIIELCDDMLNDDTGKAQIYHEVLHVVHEEIDQVVWKMRQRLKPNESDLFEVFYREAVERFMQRMSRSIVANLAKKEEVQDAETTIS